MSDEVINPTLHIQEATCGLQVCQHPMCWSVNRAAMRGLLRPTANNVGQFQDGDDSRALFDAPYADMNSSVTDDEDMFDGLPTVTILNMLDDYGYDKNDHYPSTNWTAKSRRQILSQKVGNMPPEGSHAMPKLTLKSLASQSVDDVMAPANTPLQSAHGFGDFHYYRRSPLEVARGNRKINTFKHYTDANASYSSVVDGKRTNYNKVKMELDSSQCVGGQRNKCLVWCPASKSKRVKQTDVIERPLKIPPSLRAVSLPLEQVPQFKSKATLSRQAIRGTKTKKLGQLPYQKQKTATVDGSSSPTPLQTLSSSRATPREIAQLRNIPIDVLIRVLHQAETKGVITTKQTNFLLRQVTGQKEKLPLNQEKPPADEQTQPPESHEENAPLETKNIKILGVQEVRQHSPRTMSTEPVYKLDPMLSKPLSRGLVPAATETMVYNVKTEANIPSAGHDMAGERGEKIEVNDMNETESQYNIQLREVAVENLQSIGALHRAELSTPRKPPVKYVATVFDQTVPQTPPVKPFHYPKSPRDMFLGPIPSPPLPSPPTERDSSYDEEVGGSTVMVNVPSTGPPTLTSITEKIPSSPSGGSRTPTTGRDDNRNVKMIQNASGAHNAQSKRQRVISPYGSAANIDIWPQVNEEEYLHGDSQPHSPMMSFVDEEIHSVSGNESPISSASGGKPFVEKFQDIHPGEIHSPAPPPPSPEVPPQPVLNVQHTQPQASTNDTPPLPRTGGAATALGLVALRKTSSDTSPDMGGLSPTPVVSSATTSGVETPVGRLTRSQRLGSTPAIAETPFENEDIESNDEENGKSKDIQDPLNQYSKTDDPEPHSSKSVNNDVKAFHNTKRDPENKEYKKELNEKMNNLNIT